MKKDFYLMWNLLDWKNIASLLIFFYRALFENRDSQFEHT